jgi:hypothetical protein
VPGGQALMGSFLVFNKYLDDSEWEFSHEGGRGRP